MFEALGLREGLVTMDMRDESESLDQPGPVGEKRANRFAQVTACDTSNARLPPEQMRVGCSFWWWSLALVCPPTRALLRMGALCDGARRQVLTAS